MALVHTATVLLLSYCWLSRMMISIPVAKAFSTECMTSRLPPSHPQHPKNAPYNQFVFIVQLSGKPVVAAFADVYNNSDGNRASEQRIREAKKYSDSLTATQGNFLEKNLKCGSYQKIFSFTYCLNAVAVRVKDLSQAGALEKAEGVVSVERDTRVDSHTTYTPSFLGLSTSSSGAWSLSGGVDKAGDGVVVAVVDTGITPTHPSVADNRAVSYGSAPSTFRGICDSRSGSSFPPGSCNKKLIGAQYFATSALAYSFLDSSDFLSPLDGDGHGSHTSAIAVGNRDINVTVQGQTFGVASGTAPRARLAMYKCIFRFGGILSDCIAAVQQAVVDGVNVINLSLGPASPPSGITFLSAFDLATLQAVKSGIVVVQSAGNYGPATGTLTSFSPWIITVGASTTDRTYPVTISLTEIDTDLKGYGYSGGNLPSTLLISSADAARADSTSGNLPTDCQSAEDLQATLVKGKILICFYSDNFDSGTSSVSRVAHTAKQLNASAFALIASNYDLSFPIYFEPFPFLIPGIFLTDLDSSQILQAYYDIDPSTVTASISIPAKYSAAFSSEAPIITDFSSRGPTPSNADLQQTGDVLKPDFVAPGNQIWSAWTPIGIDLPSWNSSFATRTGTSQAAPHVSGAVAMIKQKNPTWSPAAIQSALVTTAKKVANNGLPIRAQYPANAPDSELGRATPFDMGGGLLNPSAALDPGLVFDRGYQDYINFLCAVQGANPQDILQLTGWACNITSGAQSYDLNTPSITIASLRGSRQVRRTATSVGTRSETYTATVTVPTGVSLSVSPTKFTISAGQKMNFTAAFRVTKVQQQFTFGSITWAGNAGHTVAMPVSVWPVSLTG